MSWGTRARLFPLFTLFTYSKYWKGLPPKMDFIQDTPKALALLSWMWSLVLQPN